MKTSTPQPFSLRYSPAHPACDTFSPSDAEKGSRSMEGRARIIVLSHAFCGDRFSLTKRNFRSVVSAIPDERDNWLGLFNAVNGHFRRSLPCARRARQGDMIKRFAIAIADLE
jgi:hypothetical protein